MSKKRKKYADGLDEVAIALQSSGLANLLRVAREFAGHKDDIASQLVGKYAIDDIRNYLLDEGMPADDVYDLMVLQGQFEYAVENDIKNVLTDFLTRVVRG